MFILLLPPALFLSKRSTRKLELLPLLFAVFNIIILCMCQFSHFYASRIFFYAIFHVFTTRGVIRENASGYTVNAQTGVTAFSPIIPRCAL